MGGAHIVYQDDALIVAYKPPGMSVHPAPGSWSDTLVQHLRSYLAETGQPRGSVDPVSRLDRGTSGLVLFAIDPAAHPALHRQVLSHEIKREYRCLVWVAPRFERTVIELPIGRHWLDHRKMAVYDVSSSDWDDWGARPAATHLEVIERFSGSALLAATLETGRMHQIRVHCQFIRHPIVGDPVYGPITSTASRGLRWQCLHAGSLRFRHPLTHQELSFTSPIPEPFATVLGETRALASRFDTSPAPGLY